MDHLEVFEGRFDELANSWDPTPEVVEALSWYIIEKHKMRTKPNIVPMSSNYHMSVVNKFEHEKYKTSLVLTVTKGYINISISTSRGIELWKSEVIATDKTWEDVYNRLDGIVEFWKNALEDLKQTLNQCDTIYEEIDNPSNNVGRFDEFRE